MNKTSVPNIQNRRAQLFSFDNLVALLLIVFLMGASLQYLFEVENRMKQTATSYELWVVASDSIDYLVKKYANNLIASMGGNPCKNNPDCVLIPDCKITILPALPDIPYNNDYVLGLRASEPLELSTPGACLFTLEVGGETNKTTASIRRFVYYLYDYGQSGPDEEKPIIMLGLDLLAWRK